MNIQNSPSFTGRYIVKGSVEDVGKVEKICRDNQTVIDSLSTWKLKCKQDKCIAIFATNRDAFILNRAKNDTQNPIKTDKTKSVKENLVSVLRQVFKNNIGLMPVVNAEDVINVPPKKNQYTYFNVELGHFCGRDTVCLNGTKERYSYLFDIGDSALKSRELPDGTFEEYYPTTGDLKSIKRPDGSREEYYIGETLKLEVFQDGSRKNYSPKGILTSVKNTDGTLITYFENGDIRFVKPPTKKTTKS